MPSSTQKSFQKNYAHSIIVRPLARDREESVNSELRRSAQQEDFFVAREREKDWHSKACSSSTSHPDQLTDYSVE